eukprot:jgi/Botrbrau1/8826/Bobra.0335s0014.1
MDDNSTVRDVALKLLEVIVAPALCSDARLSGLSELFDDVTRFSFSLHLCCGLVFETFNLAPAVDHKSRGRVALKGYKDTAFGQILLDKDGVSTYIKEDVDMDMHPGSTWTRKDGKTRGPQSTSAALRLDGYGSHWPLIHAGCAKLHVVGLSFTCDTHAPLHRGGHVLLSLLEHFAECLEPRIDAVLEPLSFFMPWGSGTACLCSPPATPTVSCKLQRPYFGKDGTGESCIPTMQAPTTPQEYPQSPAEPHCTCTAPHGTPPNLPVSGCHSVPQSGTNPAPVPLDVPSHCTGQPYEDTCPAEVNEVTRRKEVEEEPRPAGVREEMVGDEAHGGPCPTELHQVTCASEDVETACHIEAHGQTLFAEVNEESCPGEVHEPTMLLLPDGTKSDAPFVAPCSMAVTESIFDDRGSIADVPASELTPPFLFSEAAGNGINVLDESDHVLRGSRRVQPFIEGCEAPATRTEGTGGPGGCGASAVQMPQVVSYPKSCAVVAEELPARRATGKSKTCGSQRFTQLARVLLEASGLMQSECSAKISQLRHTWFCLFWFCPCGRASDASSAPHRQLHGGAHLVQFVYVCAMLWRAWKLESNMPATLMWRAWEHADALCQM